ncbi:bifunctional DNA-formamidopyrimidine glycosylase/DNA-(apurinic or apyrimidinic site) lyase [Mesobacillus harenae]|uniref:bifunctional DNA-formamidopyrimidine glycosylase/DNA-(apurinic or apyrimidinic site) lyase n=1 Tax=Mesobacillus harenae TaxID=2213203 RepID=UPI0015800301|nr:bifunctional DNA-formamidopyrimidine glycosylase/DNA-(apurinic or apyrimidinic site) lyase [Mesobacillus harenae]
MPELPEMETYRILLSPKITFKPISSVEINRDKSINLKPAQFRQELIGSHIQSISRRAKHLIFQMNTGKSLVLHLMLGGWMYLGNEHDNPNRTKQVIITFGDISLYFIGLRLGYLHLLTSAELDKKLEDLGPEPLDPSFTYQQFQQLIDKKRGVIKSALVNQKFISGIGNCYSDEICYEAKINPLRKAEQFTETDKLALYNAIQHVLPKAADAGGYMENKLYSGDNKTGGYLSICTVYDREGEPCKRCGTEIQKETVSSRKTFYCPICQQKEKEKLA